MKSRRRDELTGFNRKMLAELQEIKTALKDRTP
jgi:hypothetical protein